VGEKAKLPCGVLLLLLLLLCFSPSFFVGIIGWAFCEFGGG
jgi:hypothetical protein